jgi:hypothetical protein
LVKSVDLRISTNSIESFPLNTLLESAMSDNGGILSESSIYSTGRDNIFSIAWDISSYSLLVISTLIV